MTPLRLVELRCPKCQENHWEIDSDYRGDDGQYQPYSERFYNCPSCKATGTGYAVLQQSPPSFFLQPHEIYPMNKVEFDRWREILRKNFPEHPVLKDAYCSWYPSDASQPTEIIALSRIEVRPAEVTRAAALLCLNLAIGFVKVIIASRVIPGAVLLVDFFSPFSFTIWIFVLYLLLIWKIWQGRNWARMTFFVIFVFGIARTALDLVRLVLEPGRHHVSRPLAILTIVQLVISAYVLFLIYGSKSQRWFQPKETRAA